MAIRLSEIKPASAEERASNERAFRRGFSHGLQEAIGALEAGANAADLEAFQIDVVIPWRERRLQVQTMTPVWRRNK